MNKYYNILFLKEFTKELIKNSAPLYIHEKIKEEKEDLEILEKEIVEKVKKDFVFPIRSFKGKKQIKEAPQVRDVEMEGMMASIMRHNKTISPKNFIPERNIREKTINETVPRMNITQIEREYPSEGIYLGELEKLVNDPNISSLDCPGPEKFISVKVHGLQKITRIQIDKQEINAVLDSFSRESRIPRIGGIFKAISNNLVLTAIDTDIAGPRFIITKTHPQESAYL